MQELETYTVRLPNGRTVSRRLPVGATDEQVRNAFRSTMGRAGFDVRQSPVQRPATTQPEHYSRPLSTPANNPTPNALLTSHTPSWGEWMGNQVYDGLNALGMPSVADRARREMSYMPFLGDAYIAGEGVSNIQNGNMFTGAGQVGLAALGAVPVVGDAAAAGVRAGARQVGGMFGGRGIRAYHGSPHDFDRFDVSRIGTGEGNQTYGHGLYFAQNEGVAREYQNILGYKHTNGAPPVDWNDGASIAGYWVSRSGGDVNAARQRLEQIYASNLRTQPRGDHSATRAAVEHLRGGGSGAVSPNPGRMYEVSINTHPNALLNWDASLADQPQRVRRGINSVLRDQNFGSLRDFGRYLRDDGDLSRVSASTAYDALGTRFGGYSNTAEDAANLLSRQGVPGIRYLDQGSRSAGQGTHNYVIFDDSLVDILRKY